MFPTSTVTTTTTAIATVVDVFTKFVGGNIYQDIVCAKLDMIDIYAPA